MSLCIGRISYLPDDQRLRDIRFKAQEKSLSSLLEVKPEGVPISIVSQNWPQKVNLPEEKQMKEHAMQQRIDYPPIGPAAARNVLLKQFYASDYDYMMIMDDDASLYNYYGVDGFLAQLNKASNDFIESNIHCIKAIEPVYTPFKKTNEQLPMRDYFMFCQAPMGNGGALFILVNLKKHFGKEIYFEETLDVKAGGEREDIDFFIRLMKAGYNVLECRNMIQKNSCNDGSKSTVFEGSEDVNEAANSAMRNTAAKHGIPVMNKRVQFSKILKFYKGWLKIPREVAWEGEMQKTNRMLKRPKGGLI